jgi:ribosome maturation protein Sdo1
MKDELEDFKIHNDKFEILMKQNQISVIRKKFEEGISDILEDAKRRKVKLKFFT